MLAFAYVHPMVVILDTDFYLIDILVTSYFSVVMHLYLNQYSLYWLGLDRILALENPQVEVATLCDLSASMTL